MARTRVGECNVLSAAAATAFNRIELNPGEIIHLTEFGISMDGPANNTDTPIEFNIQRMSTVGTGSAGTVVKVQEDTTSSLVTTALVSNTADGTLVDTMHRVFCPVVSGILWTAAPDRSIDCKAANFLGLKNISALPSGRKAALYMVFEE